MGKLNFSKLWGLEASVSFSPLPLHSSFLLSSQLSRRIHTETLATQANQIATRIPSFLTDFRRFCPGREIFYGIVFHNQSELNQGNVAAARKRSHQWCLTLTPNNTETTERMTCHCFLRPIRRDLTSSSYTTVKPTRKTLKKTLFHWYLAQY